MDRRNSSSDTSSCSDSEQGRYENPTSRPNHRRISRKRSSIQPLDGSKSKKWTTKNDSYSSKTNNERPLRASLRRRSLTPVRELCISQEAGNTSQNSADTVQLSALSVESRIERLEQLIEIIAKNGSQSENRRLSIRSNCISEFDPDNENLSAVKWIEKIDLIKNINNWDDMTTIYHVQSHLAGMARNWYHGLSSYPSCWIEWKTLIAKTFPDHFDYAMVLRKMLNRTKQRSETMTNYYFCKMELLRTCQISGSNAVSCLIDGITNVSLQNVARAGCYVTPEALYEEYLSTLHDDKLPETSTQIRFARRKTEPKYTDVKDHHFPKKTNVKNVQCFNCKLKGHYQSSCPKVRVECTKCHLLGHEAIRCNVGVQGLSSRRPDLQSTGNSLNILQNPKISKTTDDFNTC